MDPRALSPGSTMPSFSHLFGDRRGHDLVAYLQNLGEGTLKQRMDSNFRWKLDPAGESISQKVAMSLFMDTCAPCHGRKGRGDGPFSEQLTFPARNLAADPFRFFDENGPENKRHLARIIKFGVLGTDMPGHEYFSDAEIRGLIRYLSLIRNNISRGAQREEQRKGG